MGKITKYLWPFSKSLQQSIWRMITWGPLAPMTSLRPADIRCFSAKKVPNSFDAKHVRGPRHQQGHHQGHSGARPVGKMEELENWKGWEHIYIIVPLFYFSEIYCVNQMVFSICCLCLVIFSFYVVMVDLLLGNGWVYTDEWHTVKLCSGYGPCPRFLWCLFRPFHIPMTKDAPKIPWWINHTSP